jgi:hypothetical protein
MKPDVSGQGGSGPGSDQGGINTRNIDGGGMQKM